MKKEELQALIAELEQQYLEEREPKLGMTKFKNMNNLSLALDAERGDEKLSQETYEAFKELNLSKEQILDIATNREKESLRDALYINIQIMGHIHGTQVKEYGQEKSSKPKI